MTQRERQGGERPAGAYRPALAGLAVSAPLLLVAPFLGGAWSEALFAAGAVLLPVALMALGASRGGAPEGDASRPASASARRGGPVWVPGLFAVWLGVAFALLFALRGGGLLTPGPGGLPAAATVQIWGLWLLPLIGLVAAYVLTFDRWGPSEDELDRLREERRRREARGEGPG